MKKKATLLIKNLHTIYTMDEHAPNLGPSAFIAIHHDEVLDLGVHSFLHHVDKDTRILDGSNHIAVPAFIEVNACIPQNIISIREWDELFMRYMHHGTLTIHLQQQAPSVLCHNYHYELMSHHSPMTNIPVLYALKQMKQNPFDNRSSFCISCWDEDISLQNQMLAAQLLAMKEQIEAYELLKGLTCNPAAFLGLKQMGVLKKQAIANILLLSSKDIHAFFYSLDQNQIAQIIHKGVRIYPNLLI